MKREWQVKKLADIADVKGGKRVPKGYKLQSEPTGYPYITVSDFTDDGTINTSNLRYISREVFEQIKRYTISSKDLYLSIAGTIGKTGYVPPELDGASLTENACKLVLHPDIDRDFVYYFTKSEDFIRQAGTNTRIAAQPKLALERLKTIKLPLPSLAEQQRIVGILDEAFDGIATAKANAEKNRQNARALFESHLQAVFAQSDSSHVVRRLDEVCEEITVGHVGSMAKQYRDDGIPFLRSQNIRPFRVSLENVVFIDEDFHRSLAKSQLRPGDLAVVRTGYPGTAAVIPESLPVCNCSDLVIVRPGPAADSHYLALFFNSMLGKELVAGRLVGAAQKHFNVTAAKQVAISFPPVPQQRIIVAQVEDFRGETQRLESIYQQKLTALDQLKQSLLHRAFSGEL